MPERQLSRRAALAVGFTAFLTACGIRRKPREVAPTPETMGGVWETIAGQDATTGARLTITVPKFDIVVRAYPAHSTDPRIDHVNFTAYWPGAQSPDPNNPNAWPIVARVTERDEYGRFVCHADFETLGVPPGQVTLSFDVYNRVDNVNGKLAPNGKKPILYSPAKP